MNVAGLKTWTLMVFLWEMVIIDFCTEIGHFREMLQILD